MKSKTYINASPAPFAEITNGLPAAILRQCTMKKGLAMTSVALPVITHTHKDANSPESHEELNFDSIVVKYNESLHSFAFQILQDMAATEDVVQDTFLSMWVNRDKIDFNLPLRNFLYVTTRNFAYRYIRTRKRFDNNLPPVPSEEQISVYMIQEEALRILKESIDKLPERTAEVIRLSLEGMPQEKIAEQMGVGIANVKRLKTIGIAKLKEIMGPLFSLVVCLFQ